MANIRFCTLFSGSSANCTYIEADGNAILIDVGAGVRKLAAALEGIDADMDRVRGVFITHDHSDHIGGLATVLRHNDWPVFATEGTARGIKRLIPDVESGSLHIMRPGAEARNGAFSVRSFATHHDTPESVGYIVTVGSVRLGVMTDTGCVDETMLKHIDGCDALVMESNHDVEMLRTGPYPPLLKQRIASSSGHLSNDQCAEAVLRLPHPPKTLILAHLSKENNTPRLAVDTVRARLLPTLADVHVCAAPPDAPSEMLRFGETPCLR